MTDGHVEPPPLGAADVYLYAHGNGAVFLFHPDRRSRFVTRAEALEVAEACGAAGGSVFLGADAGAPLADEVADAVRAAASSVVEYEPPQRPYEWHDGADALMTAAAYGQDDLLDDLLDRGADVHATNATGGTALHHAAAAGNLHAIDRLVAAGADLDARNDAGLTPLMAAQACREHEAALRLEAAGATPSHAGSEQVTFRWTHRLPHFGAVWTVLVFAFIGGLLAAPSGGVVLAAGVLAGGLFAALVGVPRTSWRGVAPRSCDGRVLRCTGFLGRAADVDLDTVTAAAFSQVGGRVARLLGSKLLLVHPGGAAWSRRSLRGALRPKDEVDHVPEGARVTVVLLDPMWEHEVLRAVGNRLISDPVALSPRLRQRLQTARSQDPATAAGRRGPRR